MIEKGIRELLLADAGVTAMTGTRIKYFAGAQLDLRPFITILNTGASDTDTSTTLTAPTLYRSNVVEVAIITDSYGDCLDLSENVRRVLHGIAATTTYVRIAPSKLDSETDIEETTIPGQQQPTYVRTQEYKCLFKVLT